MVLKSTPLISLFSSGKMGQMTLRCAHISDLHFFSMPKTIGGFYGKNGLGILNHLLFRKKIFHSHIFQDLLEEILAQNVDELWISGDISVSGLNEEFLLAKQEMEIIYKRPLKIRVIPGNHDVRSKNLHTFYQLFLDGRTPEKIETINLNPFWDLITIDASHNEEKRDCGLFCEALEASLIEHLKKSTALQVAIMCHYPPPIAQGQNNRLVRGDQLEKLLLKFTKIALFAHGHTHKQTLFHQNNLAIANPGISRGSFGRYNLYELTNKSLKIELKRVRKKNSHEAWRNEQVFSREISV